MTVGKLQKMLVIGGNRYVGKRVVQLLKKLGHRVTVLNRSGKGEGHEVIQADRNQRDQLLTALGDRTWDLVLDFACIDPRHASIATDVFRDRVRRYVVVSSQSVYGPGPDIREAVFDPRTYARFEPENLSLDYPEAKRQMETGFFRQTGFPVVAVRFPIILGRDDYTGRLKFHVDRIRSGEEFFVPNLQARISFVDSSEAASAMVFLASHSFVGPINICSRDPIALTNLFQVIEKYVGRKALYAAVANESNHSPFGIEQDWYMNVDLAHSMGLNLSAISSWLPSLVYEL